MKSSAINIIGAMLLMTACNDVVLGPKEMGSITLSLTSDIEVEGPTKADTEVDCSIFTVTITGETSVGEQYAEEYVYGEMPEILYIPYGTYTISAQNCTPQEAETGLGCAHYYGASPEFTIDSQTPEEISVTCYMINAKASITIAQSFSEDFTDITATLQMIGGRTTDNLIDADHPSGGQGVYFNVTDEAHLIYKVTGVIAGRTLTYTNTSSPMQLLPARWTKITIGSNHNGIIGPDISVDETMGDNSFTEIIDPEGGIEIIEGALNLPTIYVNTTIDDAIVIDCELDVL